METEKKIERSVVIEKDGNMWCAHYDDFVNIQESDEVAFSETKIGALTELEGMKND